MYVALFGTDGTDPAGSADGDADREREADTPPDDESNGAEADDRDGVNGPNDENDES